MLGIKFRQNAKGWWDVSKSKGNCMEFSNMQDGMKRGTNHFIYTRPILLGMLFVIFRRILETLFTRNERSRKKKNGKAEEDDNDTSFASEIRLCHNVLSKRQQIQKGEGKKKMEWRDENGHSFHLIVTNFLQQWIDNALIDLSIWSSLIHRFLGSTLQLYELIGWTVWKWWFRYVCI